MPSFLPIATAFSRAASRPEINSASSAVVSASRLMFSITWMYPSSERSGSTERSTALIVEAPANWDARYRLSPATMMY